MSSEEANPIDTAQEPAAPAPSPINFEYAYHPKVRNWHGTKAIKGLTKLLSDPTDVYVGWLDKMLSYRSNFEAISVTQPDDPLKPYWVNGWFPALDSMSLYTLIAARKPKRYIEVGSGNSTKFARQAIKDHGLSTKIISIDPHPRAEIDQICDEVIRQPCEDVPISFFESLTADDILFVDNSHRSFQNSDVTVFFMEILPGLAKGTLVGIHDIFLPYDYIETWTDRYYNEQYLLACYIQGGMGGGEIVLPNWYVSQTPALLQRLNDLWQSPKLGGLEDRGGAFWFTR